MVGSLLQMGTSDFEWSENERVKQPFDMYSVARRASFKP